MSPENVSAVIVTRGNCDLSPILDSLIFDDVVIWDNSKSTRDEMTWGRALARFRAKHRVIYSQDDDIVHSEENQRAIVAAYEPGVLTGCMWKEWSDGARAQGIPDGYDDLVFPGSGSVYDRGLPLLAAAVYCNYYEFDDWFRLWCDTIVGVMTPNKQLNIRFEALPEADADYRMANQEGFTEQKREAIRRAREIRDVVRLAA